MIVMKFGGSSLIDAAAVRRVIEIVRTSLPRRPVVVVSAHGGVTNALLEQARAALEGRQDPEPLRRRHHGLVRDLGVTEPRIDQLLSEFTDLLRGISFVREMSPRVTDLAASFGERLSACVVAGAFRQHGVPAVAVMAPDAGLLTDSRYGRARPLPEAEEAIRHYFDALPEDVVPVVTGFIGRDRQGNTTTVGRNGSDYSAAIFAKALGAEEIQIWTDVPGVLSADPRLVPRARPLHRITFDEAAEFAFYGARVLHPATLEPAVQAGIPVRVLDTGTPSEEGTLILPETEKRGGPVQAIVHKRGVHLLTVVTPRMLGHHGFMARVFEACARYEVTLDMIATTEVSVSATLDDSSHLQALVEDLSTFAEVEVEHPMATLAVVGHGVGDSRAVVAQLFTTLQRIDVPIRMITMGAQRTNVGLILDEKDTERAVDALHRVLIEEVDLPPVSTADDEPERALPHTAG